MLLRQIAFSRAGDKGNRSTISVIAFDIKDFPKIEQSITAARVKAHFQDLFLDQFLDQFPDHLKDVPHGAVERFVLPHMGALSFVLHDALGGGVTRSLALDAHGKCLSSSLLAMSID